MKASRPKPMSFGWCRYTPQCWSHRGSHRRRSRSQCPASCWYCGGRRNGRNGAPQDGRMECLQRMGTVSRGTKEHVRHHECFTCAIDPPGYCAVRSVLVWRARDHTARPNEPLSASECATALAGRRVQSTSAAAARDGVSPESGDAADGALLLCAQSVVGGMGVARWFQF